MNTIFQFDGFELFVLPAPDVEPCHQVIGVCPPSRQAIEFLHAMTGSNEITLDVADGRSVATVPHDDGVDERLVNLGDIVAAIRRASPDMIQLSIEGMDDNA